MILRVRRRCRIPRRIAEDTTTLEPALQTTVALLDQGASLSEIGIAWIAHLDNLRRTSDARRSK